MNENNKPVKQQTNEEIETKIYELTLWLLEIPEFSLT